MKAFIFLVSFLSLSFVGQSQEIYFNTQLEGYWTGAIIRGSNSVQLIEAEFYLKGDSLWVDTRIPDWVYYPPASSPVKRDKEVLYFDTDYGQATMYFDSAYNEMVGTLKMDIPPYNFHLKKSLKPNIPKVIEKEITFKAGDIELKGQLFHPEKGATNLPAAIFVGGRGCSDGRWQAEQGRILAQYGLTCISFQERGSKDTGTDCLDMTHVQEVSDLVEIIKQVADLKETDASKIGLVTSSAGAWIGPAVTLESDIPIAWMVTIVGPSTSVEQQQLDGAKYFSLSDNYSPKGAEQVLEYTQLMFQNGDNDSIYNRMMTLLEDAEKLKWIDWLGDTDIPASADNLDNLWVRRYNFDPYEALSKFQGPFLSILGGDDDIVPYKEQIEGFRNVFGNSGKTNYRVAILPSTGHNMEHGPRFPNKMYVPQIKARPYYFKFDRVAYGAIAEIVKFMRDYKILDE